MDAQPVMLTADQVLRVFHRDEVYLFLGAAFATVGLISAALSFLGRKFDALLLWLGIFSFLYGNRLWLQTGLLALMVPPSLFFQELRESSNYLVTIPAFYYLRSAGFLGRMRNWLTYPLTAIMLYLSVGAFLVGPLPHFKIDHVGHRECPRARRPRHRLRHDRGPGTGTLSRSGRLRACRRRTGHATHRPRLSTSHCRCDSHWSS